MSHAIRRILIVTTAAAATVTASLVTAAAGTAPAWHVTTVIGTSRVSNLFSIVATGRHNAWAFGAGRQDRPLVLHWNGTAWEPRPLPGTAAPPRYASASSRDNVWAEGYTCDGGPGSPPPSADVSRWNGRRWATTEYRNLPWCPTGPLVTTSQADGWLFTGQSVAMHFHGLRWRAVSLGNVGIVAVATVVSGSDIWAFSYRIRDAKMFAIHWNGRAWRTVPLPRFALKRGQSVYPWAAYSSPSTGVWLSVSKLPGPPYSDPTMLHWTGHGWKLVAVPGTGGIVQGMAADGTGGLWCVGYYPTANVSNAFLHYAHGSWTTEQVPVNGLPGHPKRVGVAVYAIASIPGTRTLWATGELDFDNAQGVLQQYSVIDKFSG